MIVRKQLQLLICTLQIIYLFGGEVNQLLIDVEENETTETDSSPRNEHFTTSSFNVNVEDTSSSTYPRVMKVSNNAEKFSHEITTITTTKGFDQTNHLLLDGKFQHVSTTTGTPNRLLNDDKNLMASLKIEPLPCNTTTTDYHNGTVRNLTIDAISTEWILLSWQPPSPYPYGTVTHQSFAYLINVCSSEKCYKATENNTRYNATNLDPCTEYKFTVKVIDDDTCLAKKLDDVDDDDDDDGLTLKAKTNYDITKIGEIQDLVVHTTVSTVSLKWKEPSKYPMCVQNYFITIRSDYNTTRNVSVENKEYIAENLDPCKEYYIIIKAVSYVVASDGRKITLKTNSPKSSKPQDPIVEASAFSLFIRWQPPKVGSMCITHYRVTINNDPKAKATTINSSKTNVTIDGLYACTAYTVQINAVDQDQNDGDMIVIDTKTMQTVSRPPILNESFVTTNSIMLSWKIEKGNSSCILTSLKAMCNYTSTAGHGYEITNGIVEVPINSCTQDEFFIVNSLIERISPFTKYICWAYVVNEAGVSELSGLTSLTTSEDIPSTPTAAVVRNITYSQFEIAWDAPMYLPGILHEFEIIVKWEIRFSIPDWCCCDTLKSSNNTIYLNGSTFNFQYSSAIPYTNYTLKIKARTTAGWGNYSDDIVFQTPPGVPEMVSNFSYLIRNNEHDTNILDTILKWAFPCSPNGIIEYFNVFVNGTRINYAPHSFTIQQNISQTTTNQNDIISINLKELRAEYNYTFEVSGKVKGVECLGTPARHVVLYPAGIPSQPNKDYVKSITIDPSKAQRSTTSATLLLPLFPDTNGNVTYYSILVSRIEHNTTASHTRFNLSNYTWPNISSWEEAMLQDFTIPYQATRLWWDPYPNYVADYGEVKAVKYTIGEDTNCKEFSSNINNNKRIYCNGPLKSNTWYHVRMRAFTRGGYADSTTFIIKTNAEINVGLVTGVIFGILFFGILTTMMLLIRKCSPQVIIRQCLHSDMSGSPVPTPFSKKKFIAHCQQLIDNPGKLSNEFQLLQTLSVDLQMPTNTACLQANRKKNKYPDILPYDFSRVKLQVIDNDPNTDYINASFIKGYSGEDEYIACQGPKEETTFDFWRMIEQYNVNLIVMLTDLIENGKEKCYQYFPIIKETFRYENMTIRCISELEYRSYTQRTLVLQKENEKRNITHLHFKEWPDHDVPEGFDSMINFCQIVRRNILVNKGYNIVVHCSAGVGRTGTLIAIDILLQHLRDNRKLDVFGTVYRLRHHRINMVQKESQYAYVYNCIKQVLKNPYCLKTYKPPPMDPLYKNTCRTTTRLKLYKTSQ